MTTANLKIVPEDKIELVVGCKRGKLYHYARAVSRTKMVYILHSEDCVNVMKGRDGYLKNCAYSFVLDYYGIKEDLWKGFEDAPVEVSLRMVDENYIDVPAMSGNSSEICLYPEKIVEETVHA